MTKKELLQHVASKGHCATMDCFNCDFKADCEKKGIITNRLARVGAKMVLAAFKENEQSPTMTVGTKIKFYKGETATIAMNDDGECFLTFGGGEEWGLRALIGTKWEIVKE